LHRAARTTKFSAVGDRPIRLALRQLAVLRLDNNSYRRAQTQLKLTHPHRW
jgi:hypothetical protein